MDKKPLNYRQSLFAEYYTEGDTKGNATQSAIKAGYKETTAYSMGQRLLKKVEITNAIEVKRKEIRELLKLDAQIQTKRISTQYNKANEKDDIRAALQATDQLNKHIGFYREDNLQKGQTLVDIMAIVGVKAAIEASEKL